MATKPTESTSMEIPSTPSKRILSFFTLTTKRAKLTSATNYPESAVSVKSPSHGAKSFLGLLTEIGLHIYKYLVGPKDSIDGPPYIHSHSRFDSTILNVKQIRVEGFSILWSDSIRVESIAPFSY